MRGGKRKKLPRPASRRVPEKGRTTPLYFEGLILGRFGLSSTCLFEPAGNFYTFDNGEKSRRTQKSGASGLKNQAEAPLRGVSLRYFAI